MRRSLVLFVVLALVGLALVTAGDHHRDREHDRDDDEGKHHKDKKDKKDKKGCAMGDFYRRHVQCRQCVMGIDGKPQKWCATAGATTDKQGKCIDAQATCAAGTTSITSVARCPSDAPSTKHTCSLCTLDGYAWCQDELALDDEYAGECVALSNRHADAAPGQGAAGSDAHNGAVANPSESDSGSGSGAVDATELDVVAAGFVPRIQGEDNLSDFSDFRDDDHDDDDHRRHHRRRHHRRGDDSDDSDDSDSSDDSDASDGSHAAEAAEVAGDATRNLAAAKCPAGRRAVTKFSSCSSAVSQASSKRHHGKWVRRAAWLAVPLTIAVVVALVMRKRCTRRCRERRAARRAARAAANGLVIVPGTSLSAVPAPAPAASASASAPMAIATAMPVAYPVQHSQPQPPVAQPLLYSHNMGSSAPAVYQPVEGAAVEMHAMPEGSMYPGLAVGGRGYARLGQDAV